jgi:serine/threonine-protein kinase
MVSALTPGRRLLDRYVLEEPLGSGGFATVWRAHDEREDRDVAVKYATPGTHDAAAVRERFDREFAALQRVHEAGGHEHVLTPYDGSLDAAEPFFVTELVEGPTLAEAVTDGPVPAGTEAMWKLGRPVVDALAYLHEHGVAHLDVKPENVLLRPDGTPVLVDFNAAVCDADHDTTLFEADPWKPTEQTPGTGSDRRTGPPADVYAAGLVLAFLLTGAELGGEDASEVDPGDSGVDISPLLAGTIRHATARFPGERYADAGALGAALDAARDAPDPTLRLVHEDSGQTLAVRPDDVLGRDEDADVVLADPEGYVSPRHARFEAHGGGWALRDLSTNGTWVDNGEGWRPLLSDRGYDQHREAGTDLAAGRRPPRRRTVENGDRVAFVSPDSDYVFRVES